MTQLGPELGTAPSLAQEQCPVHPVTARERKWPCGLRPRMAGGTPVALRRPGHLTEPLLPSGA